MASLIAQEQPQTARKQSRHITVALSHLNKRREPLIERRAQLTKEIEEIDQAILALE